MLQLSKTSQLKLKRIQTQIVEFRFFYDVTRWKFGVNYRRRYGGTKIHMYIIDDVKGRAVWR